MEKILLFINFAFALRARCVSLSSSSSALNNNNFYYFNIKTKSDQSAWLNIYFVCTKFHRGPSSSGNRYDSSYDLKYNGGSQRPTSNLLANSGYYNPYLSKHGFYDKHTKDRISIGGGKSCSFQINVLQFFSHIIISTSILVFLQMHIFCSV